MRRIIFLVAVLILASSYGNAAEVVYPRTPAPSPDGSQIAFAYQGDIWTISVGGGEARKLTANPAYDYLPQWSPDGTSLAFSSNRYGNFDIFTLNFHENQVSQLTYFTNDDLASGWTPDGGSILFESGRNFYYHRLPVTYQVPRSGSTPEKVIPAYSYSGKISPNGRYFAFVRGRSAMYRKGYRGSSNMDIWVYDFETEEFTQLTEFEGTDTMPLWAPDSRTIYFVSDRGGVKNLWKIQADGTGLVQLTEFEENGILFPNIARNGEVIAFERDFALWVYHVQSESAEQLNIRLPLDYVTNPVDYKTYTGDATEFAVSSDGEHVAFVVRGEVFVMQEDGDFLNQVTESPWRQRDIRWAPNRDSLVYVSDEHQQNDIFLVYSGEPGEASLAKTTRFTRERLTDSPAEETDPRFSPDGESLAYIRGKGDLVVRDLESGQEQVLFEHWSTPEYRWSPDGRWIACSIPDNEFNSDIQVIDVESGESVNISRHPDYDTTPRWSPDGRRLAFLSQRTIDDNQNIYFVHLREADDELSEEEWDEYYDALGALTDTTIQVNIDFDEIHMRIRQITSLPGSESSFDWSPDGRHLVFGAHSGDEHDLWKIAWNGDDLQRLTSGDEEPDQVYWHPIDKQIYYLADGGKIVSIDAEGQDREIKAFNAQVKIDHVTEQRQKFNEAWRALNENFYDADFHGTNWEMVREKYSRIIEQIYTTVDFNDVISHMLGELNASHLGISAPGNGPDIQSGMLGLRYDEEYTGDGLKIREVLPDGPCDAAGNTAQTGEIITAVNGHGITEEINLHSLLWNTVGKKVRLTLRNPEDRQGGERTIIVEPMSYGQFMDLEYERWMKEKREEVHALSDSRVGYIHIRSMSEGPLERFEMALYAEAHDKEGLIIDVRNNGGGWTTDYLLAMLMVRRHAVTIPRDGGQGYPQGRRPLYAWTKPVAVLCNEYSYSNAEIFSHAIQTLDRGTLVGTPTGGLVISTGGIELIDGSWFRIPFRGWYVRDSMQNMENGGAIPDLIIREHPGEVSQHADSQLEAAVRELLPELED